jgi:hypothetical protein
MEIVVPSYPVTGTLYIPIHRAFHRYLCKHPGKIALEARQIFFIDIKTLTRYLNFNG